MRPDVQAFFDETTNTISYVVAEPEGARCAVIDPVLDFDPRSGRTSTASADRLLGHVRERGLTVEWILETHVHADHLSAAHVGGGTTEASFVAMRTERDRTLSMPALLLAAVQVNMRAGHLPPPEDNGVSYLKLPVVREGSSLDF